MSEGNKKYVSRKGRKRARRGGEWWEEDGRGRTEGDCGGTRPILHRASSPCYSAYRGHHLRVSKSSTGWVVVVVGRGMAQVAYMGAEAGVGGD